MVLHSSMTVFLTTIMQRIKLIQRKIIWCLKYWCFKWPARNVQFTRTFLRRKPVRQPVTKSFHAFQITMTQTFLQTPLGHRRQWLKGTAPKKERREKVCPEDNGGGVVLSVLWFIIYEFRNHVDRWRCYAIHLEEQSGTVCYELP